MTHIALTVQGRAPAIGTFGKGVAGSVSVNIGLSGGRHCETSCRHHPQSTSACPTHACYAVTVEKRPDRQPLLAKLTRHESARPEHTLGRAIDDLEKKRTAPPWIRVSTAGSLPSRPSKSMARAWQRFADYIVFHDLLKSHHIPVESASKAAAYRKLDSRLTIRESCQTVERWMTGGGQLSTVAGHKDMTLLERLAAARTMAKARREATGRLTAVCPAIVTGFKRKLWDARRRGAARRGVAFELPEPKKVKCGQCPLCSSKDVDIVYPIH